MLSELTLPPRTSKPRRTGLTMAIDTGLALGQLADLLDSCGDYLDFVKLGWGTALVTPDVAAKVTLLAGHDVDVYLGGTLLEKFLLQDRFDDFRALCHRLGVRYVEVSNGTIEMSNTAKASYVRKLAAEFQVISEVGFKDTARSEALGWRDWVDYISEDLEAGAWLVTTEARESGRAGTCRPDGSLRVDLIEELLGAGLPAQRLLFEAPSTELQAYFVRRIGPDVNLGNIAPAGVVGLETLRLGLRSDTLLTFEPATAVLA